MHSLGVIIIMPREKKQRMRNVKDGMAEI